MSSLYLCIFTSIFLYLIIATNKAKEQVVVKTLIEKEHEKMEVLKREILDTHYAIDQEHRAQINEKKRMIDKVKRLQAEKDALAVVIQALMVERSMLHLKALRVRPNTITSNRPIAHLLFIIINNITIHNITVGLPYYITPFVLFFVLYVPYYITFIDLFCSRWCIPCRSSSSISSLAF